jgi:hypothetical protein
MTRKNSKRRDHASSALAESTGGFNEELANEISKSWSESQQPKRKKSKISSKLIDDEDSEHSDEEAAVRVARTEKRSMADIGSSLILKSRFGFSMSNFAWVPRENLPSQLSKLLHDSLEFAKHPLSVNQMLWLPLVPVTSMADLATAEVVVVVVVSTSDTHFSAVKLETVGGKETFWADQCPALLEDVPYSSDSHPLLGLVENSDLALSYAGKRTVKLEGYNMDRLRQDGKLTPIKSFVITDIDGNPYVTTTKSKVADRLVQNMLSRRMCPSGFLKLVNPDLDGSASEVKTVYEHAYTAHFIGLDPLSIDDTVEPYGVDVATGLNAVVGLLPQVRHLEAWKRDSKFRAVLNGDFDYKDCRDKVSIVDFSPDPSALLLLCRSEREVDRVSAYKQLADAVSGFGDFCALLTGIPDYSRCLDQLAFGLRGGARHFPSYPRPSIMLFLVNKRLAEVMLTIASRTAQPTLTHYEKVIAFVHVRLGCYIPTAADLLEAQCGGLKGVQYAVYSKSGPVLRKPESNTDDNPRNTGKPRTDAQKGNPAKNIRGVCRAALYHVLGVSFNDGVPHPPCSRDNCAYTHLEPDEVTRDVVSKAVDKLKGPHAEERKALVLRACDAFIALRG